MLTRNHTLYFCLLCVTALTAASCGVEYLPVGFAKKKSGTEPGVFQLNGCQMKVQFWERYRGRKDTFGVSVDFINAINNGRMKVADLQVSVRELTAGKRPYRLQNIHLQYGGRHELQSHTEKLKSSAVAVSLEPGNSYTLYYSYSFEGNAKPAKRFIVTVESTYENDGKPGYLKDSIAFKRQHYFYTN